MKKLLALCLSALMLFSIGITGLAIENGTYEMNTVTSYLNPDTGKTDDGGTGNIELGEGMCRSAVYEKAVVTSDENGTVITMRMLLYSNLSNIRIAVQEAPKGDYKDVKYAIVKESADGGSADLRFSLPSPDSLIRVQMYVGPMGRDVCFYWHCDTATAKPSGGSLGEQTTGNENKSLFIDIDGHWAEKDIATAVEKGLFNGTSEITFSPDGEMTRGMFVTVLGRMSGEEPSGQSGFSDVEPEIYYAPYIAWASDKGIVSGVSDSSFAPDAPVTCEQAAAIIVRYANYKGIRFAVKSISPSLTGVSEWAKDAVSSAGKAGIITKQNTNGYNYSSPATRGDIASMLANFIKYYGE